MSETTWINEYGISLSVDASGHEHKGKGEGGGQFVRGNNNNDTPKLPTASRPKLSSKEIAAVRDYTGDVYDLLNESLRNGKTPPGQYGVLHSRLKSAFSKINTFDRPVKVYRGVRLPEDVAKKLFGDLSKKDIKGSTIQLKGYTSTTASIQTAKNHLNNSAGFMNDVFVLMEIDANKGLDTSPYSKTNEGNEGEKELLIDHDSQFSVEDIEDLSKGPNSVFKLKLKQLSTENKQEDTNTPKPSVLGRVLNWFGGGAKLSIENTMKTTSSLGMDNEKAMSVWNTHILGECLLEADGDIQAALSAYSIIIATHPTGDIHARRTEGTRSAGPARISRIGGQQPVATLLSDSVQLGPAQAGGEAAGGISGGSGPRQGADGQDDIPGDVAQHGTGAGAEERDATGPVPPLAQAGDAGGSGLPCGDTALSANRPDHTAAVRGAPGGRGGPRQLAGRADVFTQDDGGRGIHADAGLSTDASGHEHDAKGRFGKSGNKHGGADPVILKEAVKRWMADSLDFDIHFKDIANGVPGTGRLRKGAEELKKAVDAAPPNDITLYRGDNKEPSGIQSWTALKSVAQAWAKKSGGKVIEILPGHAKAMSFKGFGFNDVEQHYLVDANTIKTPEMPLSIDAFLAHDIHNRRAQGILNRSLKSVRDLSRAARKELDLILKKDAGVGEAIIKFIEKYRMQLARALTATQLAALLEGAQEIAEKVPPLGTVPVEGLPVEEQERIASVPKQPQLFPVKRPEAGDPEEIHFPTIEKAVINLASRNVLDRKQYDALDAAARAKAFTVANVSAQETLAKIRDSLAENVKKGADYETWRKAVMEEVDTGTFMSEAHSENVFRTNVQTAFSDGQAAVLAHPLVRSGFPYSSYDAIHDARVREDHLAMEGHGIGGTNVYRNDDPVFQMFRPPWDYNDRCGWTPLTVQQAAERGIAEAKTWLETGVEPKEKAHVEMPPFRPPEGFQRSLSAAPLSIQLSVQSVMSFSVNTDEHGYKLDIPLATESGKHWVTIGGRPDGSGEMHVGGFPVLLDGNGKVLKGRMKGKHVSQVKKAFDKKNAAEEAKKKTPFQRHLEKIKNSSDSQPQKFLPKTFSFNNPDEELAGLDKYSIDTQGEWAKTVSPEQRQALDFYSNRGYEQINSGLRSQSQNDLTYTIPLTDSVKQAIKHIDDCMKSHPGLSEDMILYRGIKPNLANKIKLGVEFSDDGFVSTTINKNMASEAFARKTGSAVLEIEAPKGTKALSMTSGGFSRFKGDDSENEYLLPRGQKYKVVGERKDGNNTVYTVRIVQ